jgi:predicted nicotinamide N-methyase
MSILPATPPSIGSASPSPSPPNAQRAFVREHTVLTPVPLITDIRLYTATELVPLWRATQLWLEAHDLNVPYWCVPWVGGQALGRYILENPDIVKDMRVLDFGTGSGLLAIAAARAGARSVLAVDVDPFAAASASVNAEANNVEKTITVICEDIVSRDISADFDVILAGDVWYELTPSARFAGWFRTLRAKGVRILTGDPGRAYVPSNTKELATYDVPTSLDLENRTIRPTRVLEVTQ